MVTWVGMFPGQGSQSVGMLGAIQEVYSEIGPVLDRATALLGYDLKALIGQGPAAQLNQTMYTQPAILAASWALYQAWLQASTARPTYLLGHSLGEYTAWVAAGALAWEDALDVVRCRGQYMQEAAPDGAMVALVGWEQAQVEAACAACVQPGEVLAPANLNTPIQIVVSGHAAAVDRLIAHVRERGIKMVVRLPVSVPAHCALMAPAADRLAQKLATVRFQRPHTPVVANVDADIIWHPDDIRDALVRQMVAPVQWNASIRQVFAEKGADAAVEIGPGKVLIGLCKRIDATKSYFSLESPADFEAAVMAL